MSLYDNANQQQAEADAEENIYRRLMYNMDGCDEIYEYMADNIKPITQTIAAHRKSPEMIGKLLLGILADAIADTEHPLQDVFDEEREADERQRAREINKELRRASGE